jgi:FixJ family two-component response regulator
LERCDLPIIFLSSHVDLRMALKAIKGGALEFLIKPFDSDVLLNAIRFAIKRDGTEPRNETSSAANGLWITHSSRMKSDDKGGIGITK